MKETGHHDTIHGILKHRAEATPDKEGFYALENDRWQGYTWKEIETATLAAAGFITRSGIQPGDRVGIMATTRLEWMISEWAILSAGAVVVGIDAHAPEEHVSHVMKHANIRGLIVDSESSLNKTPTSMRQSFRFIATMDDCHAKNNDAPIHVWQDFVGSSVRGSAVNLPPVTADSMATLIYTSGTTGTPKAIPYTHSQLLSACNAICDLFPETESTDRSVCWLPMAHLFQRMMNLVAVAKGSPIYFNDDPRRLADNLRTIRPAVLIGVPRLFEKIHENYQQRISKAPRPLRGIISPIARLMVKRALGGRLKFMLTGSAPCPLPTLAFFDKVGLPLFEAYGISENAIPMAVNRFDARRSGSVGRPLLQNEIRFADDNEILVRGPGVFAGYEKDGDKRDYFTPDGFYKTGDYGFLDDDGYLFLKGRKSDLIKTSTGRRISPAKIERLIEQRPCFEHAVVIGRGRKHLAALLTLNIPWLRSVYNTFGKEDIPTERVKDLPELQKRILNEIDMVNRTLPPHEQIYSFSILSSGFSMEAGELTPTLKVKRKAVEDRHKELINLIYAHGSRPGEC